MFGNVIKYHPNFWPWHKISQLSVEDNLKICSPIEPHVLMHNKHFIPATRAKPFEFTIRVHLDWKLNFTFTRCLAISIGVLRTIFSSHSVYESRFFEPWNFIQTYQYFFRVKFQKLWFFVTFYSNNTITTLKIPKNVIFRGFFEDLCLKYGIKHFSIIPITFIK